MSRIGKSPIAIPKGVEVKVEKDMVKVKGPKGSLERKVHHSVNVAVKDGVIVVEPKAKTKESRPFHGLTRTLVANMVAGCEKGWSKSLTLVGVGYRAAMQGKTLNLSLGFSHPVNFEPAPGITIAVDKQTTILVSGPSRELVGETAAKIRGIRPPEPYHGKGVRYTEERIVTKVGKAAGKK